MIAKFNRFSLLLKRFFPQLRIYGFSVAISCLFFPFNRFFGPFKFHVAVHKHRVILKYLFERYKNIFINYSNKNAEPCSFIKPDSIIWVCWWDGEDKMPTIVKACYDSLQKHSGLHPVQLINKYNFNDFITIPQFIIEKVNNGKISVTHFSNIVRANLLYEYGGIWLDATIMVLKDISLEKTSFFTLKAPANKSVSITLTRFAGLSDFSKRFKNQSMPGISRWSGFLLAGARHSLIFEYLRDILHAYWKDHDDQIDYLLFDYTIALGYDNIPMMKNEIENVPCSSMEKFELEKILNDEYSENKFKKFYTETYHKLTWKKNFKTVSKNNRQTVYGHLLNS